MAARPAPPRATRKRRSLRVAYAIQNVGGIDLRQDVGDTVPVKQTLLGLQRAGHEVTCYQLNGRRIDAFENVADLAERWIAPQGLSGTRPFRLLESGVRRVQARRRWPYFALFDSLRYYEAARRVFGTYQLCHEHNGLFSVGAALACRRLGLPYVLTVSADPLFERAAIGRPLRGLSARIAAAEAAFTYRQAGKIICVATPARDHMVAAWGVPPEKIAVMPNGVDTALFTPEADPRAVRAQWGLARQPIVAFVGGFQPWHGLEELIEAMVAVRAAVPAARLLLVGDGRARPLVDAAIAAHGLADAVVVTGLMPQKEIPAFLAAADVAVLPYPRLPGDLWFSPLKLYEYMAAGKAIVATEQGQIAEVLVDDENGRLTPPGDGPALAAAITDLLQRPDARARLGAAARRQAVERHGWDEYIRRLENIYESVL